MSTSISLLPSLQANINQAQANIPLAHQKRPKDIVSDPKKVEDNTTYKSNEFIDIDIILTRTNSQQLSQV
jgi:hypothetical protein